MIPECDTKRPGILSIYLVILAASPLSIAVDEEASESCRINEWTCLDGSCIPSRFQCDGVVDCRDASDENIDVCRQSIYLRSLAIVEKLTGIYKQNSLLEGTKFIENLTGVGIGNNTTILPRPQNPCKLPKYPTFGTYNTDIINAKPGDAYESVTINVICQEGYGVDGPSTVKCQNGVWLTQMPYCVSQCHLPLHPSIDYRCVVSGNVIGYRNCSEFEPFGTVVVPECRSSDYYYSPTPNVYMRCKSDGKWDYVAKCFQECGTVTADGFNLIYGGRNAKIAEVPWHAGIYTKTKKPFQQICGGSLVSNNVIISAAHCFWNEFTSSKLPSSEFAVAVGKLFRPWNESKDKAQTSDVKELHFPTHFRGSKTHFQSDISVIITKDHFTFNNLIRPVCVDFNVNFEKYQLRPGELGKVAGWGLTSMNGAASPVLQVIELPFVDTGKCIAESPERFIPFISTDKICAGFNEVGKAVCKGDSGGGLAFATLDKGVKRYYLRGIVSTAPTNDYDTCNVFAYTCFTQLQNHEHFIKEYWRVEDTLTTDIPVNEYDRREAACELPPYPDHGQYITNVPDAKPGQAFHSIVVNATCLPGFGLDGPSSVFCVNGRWSKNISNCVPVCRLKPHPSVEYKCLVSGATEGFRTCEEYEITGTMVSPQCSLPYYYTNEPLSFMRCIDGNWDYIAKCTPECGQLVPYKSELTLDEKSSTQPSEIPWHAGIYKKIHNQFTLRCGGSLIANDVVLTAASCFWLDGSRRQENITDFAIAVGKIKSSWDDNSGEDQRSDIEAVHLPVRFQGMLANFQSDIAVVIVKRPFKYTVFVRPVCIDFNIRDERYQLRSGNSGTMASWPSAENGPSNLRLQVTTLPYLEVEQCITESIIQSFSAFITSDKLCGRYNSSGPNANNTVCRGNTGSGWAFPEFLNGKQRFFLRGILSVTTTDKGCVATDTILAFTQISKHENFIKEHLGVDADNKRTSNNICKLPEYPAHGTYYLSKGPAGTKPGDTFDLVTITVRCHESYHLDASDTVHCFNGWWTEPMPKCLPQCRLKPDPSIFYDCLNAGLTDRSNSTGRERPCKEFEKSGTVVKPRCRSPNYYSPESLKFMRCINGTWDYVAKCLPECGVVRESSTQLIIGGKAVEDAWAPWHAAIYTKKTDPFKLICGGSLVKNSVVITAAHCFLSPEQRLDRATYFAVAVGKRVPLWDDSEIGTQQSNVMRILVPRRFQGDLANYQDDIAAVILEKPFTYNVNIGPICVNFDIFLRKNSGHLVGKVAGWGVAGANRTTQALKAVEVDYVEIGTCIAEAAPDLLRPYITSDKMCAKLSNAALCVSDSGSGHVIKHLEREKERYYLSGVLASVTKSDQCYVRGDTVLFTQLWSHEAFLKINL